VFMNKEAVTICYLIVIGTVKRRRPAISTATLTLVLQGDKVEKRHADMSPEHLTSATDMLDVTYDHDFGNDMIFLVCKKFQIDR